MNLLKYISKVTILAASLAIFALPSCTDEIIDGSVNNNPSNAQKKITYYLPVRLNLVDNVSTRATGWDSEDDKATRYFDRGLKEESALYFPQTTESPDDPESSETPDSPKDTESLDDTESQEITDIHHFILIFDNADNLVGDIIPLVNLQEGTGNAPYYDSYVAVHLLEDYADNFEGKKFGDWQIFTVVNASDKLIEVLKNIKTLSAFKAITNTTSLPFEDLLYLKKNDNTYFTMTSSMVIKDNKVVPAHDLSLTENILYSSEEEARNSTNHYKVYVERLHSKYTVIFNYGEHGYVYLDNAVTTSKDGDEESGSEEIVEDPGTREAPLRVEHILLEKNGPTDAKLKIVKEYERSKSNEDRRIVTIEEAEGWKVNIIGWGVNGIETEEKLIKLIGNYNYYPGWQEYNGSYPYRTFWAEDPHYSSTIGGYPRQYRRAVEKFTQVETGISETLTHQESYVNMITKRALEYFSFENLSKKDLRQYVPENTFNESLLYNESLPDKNPYKSLSYLRASSHLIITAQLLIKGLDRDLLYDKKVPNYDQDGLIYDSGNAEVVDKYYMNDIYWSEQAYKEYVAEYLGYMMLEEQDARKGIIGKNNDGILYVKRGDAYSKAKGSDFKIVPAWIQGGDNKVYLEPEPGVTLCTFDPDYVSDEETDDDENPDDMISDEAYTPLTEAQYLNLVYKYHYLMAEVYTNGRMYYPIGTKHNSGSENFIPSKPTIISTGDFGTVRNNWYSFRVESITKPGVGVHSIGNPIVPNVYLEEAIGVGLEILEWHPKYASVEINGQKRPGNSSGNDSDTNDDDSDKTEGN